MKSPVDLNQARIAIFGAGSAIAAALAKRLAARGARLALAARDAGQLDVLAADLNVRGVKQVSVCAGSLTDHESQRALLSQADSALGGIDIAVLAWGVLGDNELAAKDFRAAREILEVNFLSYVSLMTELSNYFESRGGGQIVVLGSVAGDRGRRSNYVYGTSKAAVETFCEGLRNRLASRNVHVLLVKPGMVDTPMTAHMPKGPLFATPDKVAADIENAMRRGKDTIYSPVFWRPVMTVIRAIPERIFKKLKL